MLDKLRKKNIYSVYLPDVEEKALSENAGTWRKNHNDLDEESAPSKPCEDTETLGRKPEGRRACTGAEEGGRDY